VQIAAELRAAVRERVGLPITVGVARTKFLAKVASGVAKPDGLLLVPPEAELAFLHPLAVERLWGVGPVTARKLHALGIRTVGEVAQLDRAALVTTLGVAAGRHLHALAHNLDPRPVVVGRRRKSMGAQHAMGRSLARPGSAPEERTRDIEAIASGLVDRVTRRMRSAGRVGRTVTIRLRFDDFTRMSRSHTLAMPTSHTPTILEAVRRLLTAAAPTIERQGLTLLGIAVENLDNDGAVQLELPLDAHSGVSLDEALDAVRDRFGSGAVTRATMLGRDPGLVMPMLPD
jgi:DNA polymerase-4